MKAFAGKTILFILTTAVLGSGFSMPSSAKDEEHTIQYRRATMRALGGHMYTAAAIVSDEVGMKSHLASHVASLYDISRMIKDLFPKGSNSGDTAASPAVWENPEEFKEAVAAIEAATANLSKTVKEGGDSLTALAGVGVKCQSCHEIFQK